jgi:hypothetical protein
MSIDARYGLQKKFTSVRRLTQLFPLARHLSAMLGSGPT